MKFLSILALAAFVVLFAIAISRRFLPFRQRKDEEKQQAIRSAGWEPAAGEAVFNVFQDGKANGLTKYCFVSRTNVRYEIWAVSSQGAANKFKRRIGATSLAWLPLNGTTTPRILAKF